MIFELFRHPFNWVNQYFRNIALKLHFENFSDSVRAARFGLENIEIRKDIKGRNLHNVHPLPIKFSLTFVMS